MERSGEGRGAGKEGRRKGEGRKKKGRERGGGVTTEPGHEPGRKQPGKTCNRVTRQASSRRSAENEISVLRWRQLKISRRFITSRWRSTSSSRRRASLAARRGGAGVR